MPTIIHAPGKYVTRDGRTAIIHDVKPPKEGVTHFAAKGTVYTPSKSGKTMRSTYNIWHVSGRALVLQESPVDIISVK